MIFFSIVTEYVSNTLYKWKFIFYEYNIMDKPRNYHSDVNEAGKNPNNNDMYIKWLQTCTNTNQKALHLLIMNNQVPHTSKKIPPYHRRYMYI